MQYLCYDKGLSARHYDDQDETDDDDYHDSLESVVEEEEVQEERQWESLPNTALLNIFCKSELKDRLQSIPLVCSSWKSVTDDPRCWSSMIPDSVSPEDAFIKDKSYYFESYEPKSCIMKYIKGKDYDFLIGISRLFKEEGDYHEVEEEEVLPVGLKRLRTLIKKSGGGAAITTLYLDPFFPDFQYWRHDNIDPTYDDKTLHLIANCCPNLKHISFNVWGHTSMEVVLRLFNRCKKLELIQLFYCRGGFHRRGGEFDDEQALLELLSCLPNLRGFRIYGCNIAVARIVTHLPQLKLLSLVTTSLTSKDLSIILVSCPELQYLHVYQGWPMLNNGDDDILHQASSQIPEFHYDYYYYYYKCRMSPPPSYIEDYCDDWDLFVL